MGLVQRLIQQFSKPAKNNLEGNHKNNKTLDQKTITESKTDKITVTEIQKKENTAEIITTNSVPNQQDHNKNNENAEDKITTNLNLFIPEQSNLEDKELGNIKQNQKFKTVFEKELQENIEKSNKIIKKMEKFYKNELHEDEKRSAKKIKQIKEAYENQMKKDFHQSEKKRQHIKAAYEEELKFLAKTGNKHSAIQNESVIKLKEKLAKAYDEIAKQTKNANETKCTGKSSNETTDIENGLLKNKLEEAQATVQALEARLKQLEASKNSNASFLSSDDVPIAPPPPLVPDAPPPPPLVSIRDRVLKEVLSTVSNKDAWNKTMNEIEKRSALKHSKLEAIWIVMVSDYSNDLKKIFKLDDLQQLNQEIKEVMTGIIINQRLEKNPSKEQINSILKEKNKLLGDYATTDKMQGICDFLFKFMKEKPKQITTINIKSSDKHSLFVSTVKKTTLSIEGETDPSKKKEILIQVAKENMPQYIMQIYQSIRKYLGYTTYKEKDEEFENILKIKKIYTDIIIPSMSTYLGDLSDDKRKKLISNLLMAHTLEIKNSLERFVQYKSIEKFEFFKNLLENIQDEQITQLFGSFLYIFDQFSVNQFEKNKTQYKNNFIFTGCKLGFVENDRENGVFISWLEIENLPKFSKTLNAINQNHVDKIHLTSDLIDQLIKLNNEQTDFSELNIKNALDKEKQSIEMIKKMLIIFMVIHFTRSVSTTMQCSKQDVEMPSINDEIKQKINVEQANIAQTKPNGQSDPIDDSKNPNPVPKSLVTNNMKFFAIKKEDNNAKENIKHSLISTC